jgi:para-nitrobenzyl esterase
MFVTTENDMKLKNAMAALACAACAAAGADPLRIDGGLIAGVDIGGVHAYRGIPYAAAPVGQLRWRAPQPVPPWQGVRQAAEYGNDCAQLPFPQDSAPIRTAPSEDCLFLNVWTPGPATGKGRPVLVWIHGGDFVTGGSSPAVYDGAAFARRGVVLVSFNYRLGRFGFFAHPALTGEQDGAPLGNYGVMDQIAALAWVKRNIAAFGGAPGNVTVFGESAGGSSVGFLMTSPHARGLLHKAIIQSGTLRKAPVPFGDAEAAGAGFAASVGVPDGPAAAAALRALPTSAVLAGVAFDARDPATYSGPMVDGRVLVEAPLAAFAVGHQARVPLLVGSNSFEWGFMLAPRFSSTAQPAAQVLAPFGARAEVARTLYAGEIARGGQALAVRLFSDRTFVEPARFAARTHTAAGHPAYLYRFSYVAEAERAQWRGALHASELPFVFGTVAARYGARATAADLRTSARLQARWVAFARTGSPQDGAQLAWPRYDTRQPRLLDIDTTARIRRDDDKARLDWVESLNTANEH